MLKMARNILLKKPVLAVFDVTKRCNSKCEACSIWRRKHDASKELSLHEIECIFKDLRNFGIKHVFLQGGEPLLRKDLPEIIDLMLKLGFIPSIVTNGTLLTDDFLERFSKLRYNIGISLDTLDKKKYFKIRGINAFDKVISNINLLSGMKFRGVRYLTSVVSRLNYSEVEGLREFAKNKGFLFQAYPYNYNICRISARSEILAFDKELNKVINSFEILAELSRRDNSIIDAVIYDEIVKYLKGSYSKPCDALKYSLMIDEQGRLCPCIELPPIADLKKEKIKDVWERCDMSSISACYFRNPCFYGCTRSIGLLITHWRSILKFILIHPGTLKDYYKSIL